MEDWDPPEGQETWVREGGKGQLGHKVKREGRDMVKLDRAGQDLCVPLTSDWIEVKNLPTLSQIAMAQIAWAADRAFLAAMGRWVESRIEWLGLDAETRRRFMLKGPEPAWSYAEQRSGLYNAIMSYLKDSVG